MGFLGRGSDPLPIRGSGELSKPDIRKIFHYFQLGMQMLGGLSWLYKHYLPLCCFSAELGIFLGSSPRYF